MAACCEPKQTPIYPIASTKDLLNTAWPAMAPQEVPMTSAPMLALVAHTAEKEGREIKRERRAALKSGP